MSWKSVLWYFVVAISATAAVLLGTEKLEKLGVRIFPNGKDAGFSCKPLPSGKGLQLWANEGELSCVLKLKIKGAILGRDKFDARFEAYKGWPQQSLACDYHTDGWIELHQPDRKVADPKFTWYPARPIELIYTEGPLESLELEDWSIHPKEQGDFDSKSASFWRTVTFWVFLASLFLPVYEAVNKFSRSPEPMTPEKCVRGLIECVEGDNTAETKRLRKLLLQVIIQRRSVQQALDSVGVRGHSARGATWTKARGRLRDLFRGLNDYGKFL